MLILIVGGDMQAVGREAARERKEYELERHHALVDPERAKWKRENPEYLQLDEVRRSAETR